MRTLSRNDIARSRSTIVLLAGYRAAYYSLLAKLINEDNTAVAKKILAQLKAAFGPERFPYTSDDEKEYLQRLTEAIEGK